MDIVVIIICTLCMYGYCCTQLCFVGVWFLCSVSFCIFFVLLYMLAFVHVYVHIYICMCMHVYICVCLYYICVYMYASMCIHILGPILFILYTQPLTSIILKHPVSHMLYADDMQVYSVYSISRP